MRIFLTGATGYIGGPVLDALVRGGHDVTALVRDNEKARRVKARGGHPVIGNLADPESFRGSADAQDGYVHAAFDYASGKGPAIERAALETIIAAAKRPLVASTIVVRPGVVYGGGGGIVGDIFKSATNGLVRVVGDGNNHWPLVYDRDLADLYAKLAVNVDASGIYHANDEGDERVNDLVSAIAPYVPVRPDVRNVPIDEARTKMGPFADALALDQLVRSPRAHALGWTPTLHSVAGNAARLLEEWRAARN